MKTIKLEVRGMTCAHCEESVIKALKKINGITEIEVNRFENYAQFRLDETKANQEQVKQAIEAIGFQVV
ncbi:MAG: cation transporter [bacterium]|nr:cation transporter [bacterium]